MRKKFPKADMELNIQKARKKAIPDMPEAAGCPVWLFICI